MYELIWFDKGFRFGSTNFINPHTLHIIEVDERKSITRRLSYDFDDLNLDMSNYLIKNSIVGNWRKILRDVKNDIDKDSILVFAYNDYRKDFMYMMDIAGINMSILGDVYMEVHPKFNHVILDNKSNGAEAVYNMYRYFIDIDIDELIKYNEENQWKSVPDTRLSRNSHVKYKNSEYRILYNQVMQICNNLGFCYTINEDMLRIFTISGDWMISLTCRPCTVYRNTMDWNKKIKVISSPIYSPLDAIIYINECENKYMIGFEKSMERFR